MIFALQEIEFWWPLDRGALCTGFGLAGLPGSPYGKPRQPCWTLARAPTLNQGATQSGEYVECIRRPPCYLNGNRAIRGLMLSELITPILLLLLPNGLTSDNSMS